MQKTRALRASSTRDVCVFCAARQFSRDRIIRPFRTPTLSQRRYLNSSSKAPQYAAEELLYQEQPQALSLAQRRRLAQQSSATAFSQPSPSFSDHRRASIPPATEHPPRFSFNRPQENWRQPRRPVERANEGRQHNAQFGDGFARRTNPRSDRFPPRTPSYRINMDSRASPVMQPPEFGSVQYLRRRNAAHPTPSFNAPEVATSETPAPRKPIRKLDTAELDRLLKDNSVGAAGSDAGGTVDKWFSKPSLIRSFPSEGVEPDRTTRQTRSGWEPHSKAPESFSNSAQEWSRKQQQSEEALDTNQYSYGGDRRSQNTSVDERRRQRFLIEDDQASNTTRGQYSETLPSHRSKEDRRRRNNGRMVRDIDDEDELEERMSKAELKRARKEAKRQAQMQKEEPTPVHLPEYISVANLASLLKLRVEDFVKKLEEFGFEDVQNNHVLNAEHAGLIAQEYNFEPIIQIEEVDEDLHPAPELSPEEYAALPAKPPVVTIMGHVDHGKTTILDYMRNSSVAAGEFGGITQHIGAFSVPLSSGKKITFLDTPGHSAFETMRKRGANVTDIVVLVVAADDSVKPQTVEAIKHAQAAGVPMIVAINKIDKDQANPEKVKQDLGRHGVEVEDFGGEVQTVCVSGKTGQGIPELEEAISTLSEILDHRADPLANVEGWVLEGSTKRSGRVATVLVRSGTLRVGDIIVAGTTWARVRTLKNEAGVAVEEVGPGLPVEVDGWREQPIAGDEVLQAADEQQAHDVTEFRLDMVEREKMAKDVDAINDSRKQAERKNTEEADSAADAEVAVEKSTGPDITNFIVKGDVSGSVEAVVDSVSAIGNNEVGCLILRSGVGPPSEFDIEHAASAKGHIINFNTVVPPAIAQMAEQKGVQILDSNIIYRVVENVKAMLSEKLSPRVTSRVIGEAEIAAEFEIGVSGKKKMKVAGSKVRNGIVDKKHKFKVFRGDKVVFDGTLSSLKNQKKDVDQMRKDTECGIAFEGWEDFKIGDKIQCYEEIYEKRSL